MSKIPAPHIFIQEYDRKPPHHVRCFRAGTRILTEQSEEIAVENLRRGDIVRSGLAVRRVHHISVDCVEHPNPEQVWPVRIRVGAFGPGQPHRDLWLSPDHAVFIGGALIPVKYLVNGSTIAQVLTAAVTYYHVELPRHSILVAEGLSVESYLDTGDGLVHDEMPSDQASFIWEAYGLAPLVVTGPILDAARAQIACVSAAQAHGAAIAGALRGMLASNSGQHLIDELEGVAR